MDGLRFEGVGLKGLGFKGLGCTVRAAAASPAAADAVAARDAVVWVPSPSPGRRRPDAKDAVLPPPPSANENEKGVPTPTRSTLTWLRPLVTALALVHRRIPPSGKDWVRKHPNRPRAPLHAIGAGDAAARIRTRRL